MIIKKFTKYLICFFLSFVIVNAIAFVFYHDALWLPREGGATKGIYAPDHFILRSDEGFAFWRIDKNGYINRSEDIGEDYVLVFGKSQTNAVEVMPGNRYVDILDDMLFKETGKHVYCVARGGNTFSDLLSGFNALIKEFPYSSAVILEISGLDSAQEMEMGLVQRSFDDKMNADYLLVHQTNKQKIAGFIKEYTPLLAYCINFKIPDIKIVDKNAFLQAKNSATVMASKTDEIYEEGKKEILEKALKMLRSEYDGRIIILYHPFVKISHDGELVIVQDSDLEMLKECCDNNDIELCDVSAGFLSGYKADYSVPYGFWNTSMGEGHLNKEGHSAIASYLYESYLSVE